MSSSVSPLSSAVFWHPVHCCMGRYCSLPSEDVASHCPSPCCNNVLESFHACPPHHLCVWRMVAEESTHARTHARTHAHTHARTHAQTQTYRHTHTHKHARKQARTHALTYARMYARAHTHTHTHTHTHKTQYVFFLRSPVLPFLDAGSFSSGRQRPECRNLTERVLRSAGGKRGWKDNDLQDAGGRTSCLLRQGLHQWSQYHW